MEETLTSNDKVEAINGDGEMAYDIPYPRGWWCDILYQN